MDLLYTVHTLMFMFMLDVYRNKRVEYCTIQRKEMCVARNSNSNNVESRLGENGLYWKEKIKNRHFLYLFFFLLLYLT